MLAGSTSSSYEYSPDATRQVLVVIASTSAFTGSPRKPLSAANKPSLATAGAAIGMPIRPKMHRVLSQCRYGVRTGLAGPHPVRRRPLSTTSRLRGYAATLPHLRIGSHTRVIFQGFTGKQVRSPYASCRSLRATADTQPLKATANAKDSIAWGTNIVGGVTPGRTGEHLGLPVLPTVRSVSRRRRLMPSRDPHGD